MKRTLITLAIAIVSIVNAMACPVCERNQPKVLKGVVHGAGPENQWDYVIVWIIVAITVVTLFYSVKWLIRPGEKNKNHIKYYILNEDLQ